jgi:hypothetical protein
MNSAAVLHSGTIRQSKLSIFVAFQKYTQAGIMILFGIAKRVILATPIEKCSASKLSAKVRALPDHS